METVRVTVALRVRDADEFALRVTDGVRDRVGVLDGVDVTVPDGVGSQLPDVGTSSSHVGLVPLTTELPPTLSP